MEDRGVGEAIAGLLTVEVAGCDRAGLAGVVKLSQRVRGWVDAVDVAIARRSRELAAEGRSESATEVLTGHGRRSTRETKAVADPALAQAAKQLDEGGRERLNELADDLLGFARLEPVAVFERRCRLLGKRLADDEGEGELERKKAAVSVRRWVDKPTGMHHTHLSFDPERDAKLWAAIDAQLAAIKQTDGLHENSLCETADGIPLPPETVRRMACEAAIVPIVLNGAGEVLDCGREHRVANRAQRRALRAMYRTCAYPGCYVVFERCDIHHVIEWIRHWRLRLDEHRVITIHRPDGTQHFHGTTTNRSPRTDRDQNATVSPTGTARATGPP